jgi:hypothetical protein
MQLRNFQQVNEIEVYYECLLELAIGLQMKINKKKLLRFFE